MEKNPRRPPQIFGHCLNQSVAVWSLSANDSDSLKLALRLGVPLHVGEEPPRDGFRWLLFLEEDVLFLHDVEQELKPLVVDYLREDFRRRWRALSRNDILLKALGVKKGVRTICDPTCGLGYDAFLLAIGDLEVTACERNPVVAELVMNALLRIKDMPRFEEFPFYFYFGDGQEFLRTQGAGSFDAVYLDPMFPREEGQSAKQKKGMQVLRGLVGEDPDVAELFAAAWAAARKRVVVKRADDSTALVGVREPDFSLEGKTVRYDIYLKTVQT